MVFMLLNTVGRIEKEFLDKVNNVHLKSCWLDNKLKEKKNLHTHKDTSWPLQEEIEELERENRLHNQQEAMLKEELRNMERSKKREGVDMTYLKNVILKLLETDEIWEAFGHRKEKEMTMESS
ncbi:hypothetical protein HPP92_003508 [Vanilla planifolia]|uniref:Uncharacterized protein n=1 Tax=Vanilla planifolia TaxID=51239 RepID=A0A835VH99_VANPL|nr:hypothetical protein HPP92_003508 [Vanilla planifolia]